MVHCMLGASTPMVVGSEWRMVENHTMGVGMTDSGAAGGGGGSRLDGSGGVSGGNGGGGGGAGGAPPIGLHSGPPHSVHDDPHHPRPHEIHPLDVYPPPLAGERGYPRSASPVYGQLGSAPCPQFNNNNNNMCADTKGSLSGSETEPSLCAGCGGKIIDRYYLLAVDKQWHINCLKCCECKLRLDSELTCFAKDGSIYCKEDYYRRFAVKRCARCHLGISSNELVMRAREHVYHVGCFTCASCTKALTTGDYFGMKENMIYCRSHYEILLQDEYMPSMSPALPPGPQTPLPYYNGVGTAQKGRPRKRKSPGPDGGDRCGQGLGMDSDGLMGDGYSQGGHNQPPRQKRVRTSFKHHQLRTMKSYFALNHNPDAKDLKQLASKTGLSKRVLQVWFQNARAKYRRNMLKQQDGKGGGDIKTDIETPSLSEMSNTHSPHSPSGLSDISSTPSLSELGSASIEADQNSSGSSLTELFSNSINAMN